jgi:predicted transcriptional regulator
MIDEPMPKAGSFQDLSRRMDRMEQRQDDQAREMTTLAGAVARVEDNVKHQAELNKLRFDSLDTATVTIRETLERFMGRINAIISGEVRLPTSEALLKDWSEWREEVEKRQAASEDRLAEQAVLNGQVRLLGRIAVLLVTSNVIAIFAGIAAFLKP